MGHHHRRRVFFPFNELRDELHRPGSVERDQGDDFFKGTQTDLTAELLHAARFQLKDAGCATRVKKVVGLPVIEGDLLDVEVR